MPEEKKTCSYVMRDGTICGRDLYDTEHCIFHSRDIERKKHNFNGIFWKEFERQKQKEKEYNFMGFVFPGPIYFDGAVFDRKTNFNFTRFHGVENDFTSVIFEKEVSFFDAEFLERTTFYKVKFNGKTNFDVSRFKGSTDFKEAIFGEESKFNQTQFYGEIFFTAAQFHLDSFFQKAKFSEDADFHHASFGGIADFSGAMFNGEANFGNTRFAGLVSFSYTQFSGYAGFVSARFYKGASFGRSHFMGRTDYGETEFSIGASFINAQFSGDTNFVRAKFLKSADFNRTKFSDFADFRDITIEGHRNFKMLDTYFYDVDGLINYIKQNKKKFNYSKKFFLRVTKFLPENFKLILGEGATARYPIISRKIRDDIYLLKFKERHPFWYFLWLYLADCGRGFLRWTLWSILYAVFFALIYHNVFYLHDRTLFEAKHVNEIWSGFSFIYYSVVTFTTLGFGDIIPKSGWLQFWVMLEVILGYIMLGGLISILANKLARRS